MTTDIAVIGATDLESVDPASREAALTAYLTGARDWLAKAVDLTGPETIASAKAEIATAAEAAKQLGLSKEIQLDAQEMVRRAEYALGKAIRRGQEEGSVSRVGSRPNGGASHERVRMGRVEVVQGHGPDETSSLLVSPSTFLPHKQEANQVYALSDEVSASEFDDVLAEAKDEGNLSRANIVRKANALKGKDLSVETACGIDNSFADGLRGVRSWLDTLTTNPTPEQAEALANTLRRYLKRIERSLP